MLNNVSVNFTITCNTCTKPIKYCNKCGFLCNELFLLLKTHRYDVNTFAKDVHCLLGLAVFK